MKRLSLAVIFACCALAAASQDEYRVSYKGSKPTIADFEMERPEIHRNALR